MHNLLIINGITELNERNILHLLYPFVYQEITPIPCFW